MRNYRPNSETRTRSSWLDKLHGFLSANGFDDELRGLRDRPRSERWVQHASRNCIVTKTSHRELKEIAQLVGWDLRSELRDTRFGALSDELGAGDIDSDLIIPKLIGRLRECMEEDAT